jgi:transposase
VEVERIGRLYRVRDLSEHYRKQLSGYDSATAAEELFHPENMGKRLAIDETSLVRGELFSILTNKDTGKLIALMEGTKASEIVAKLMKHLPVEKRMAVEEVTLDMDTGFEWVTNQCFLNAEKVVDRFHVQKLVMECVQALRITDRQKILHARREARKNKQRMPKEHPYENGDTPRELLARSRYFLFKPAHNWTEKQKQRALILFREHPDIQRAYELSQQLKQLYDKNMHRDTAIVLLRQWCEACHCSAIPEMEDAAATVLRHEGRILNFWSNRATNAFAESFNAKLKHFRGMLRGIRDLKFFLFRCEGYFC